MKSLATYAVLASLSLTGCSNTINMNPLQWWSGPVEQASEQLAGAVRYQCDGNKRFAVRYGAGTPTQPAMAILPEREFRLDPVPGASGARYSNGRNTLSVQGDEASMEENGAAAFANCKRAA